LFSSFVLLASCFGGNAIHNHILVGFALVGFDRVNRQKDSGITVTRIARGVLRCFALNVVRRGHSPTGYSVRVGKDDTVPFEQIGVGRHVAHHHIVVRVFGGLVGIPTDSEIEPRWIEGAEGKPFGILPRVTIGAILVGKRVAHLARQLILVQDVLLDVRVAHRIFVTRFAGDRGLVPHRRAHLPTPVHRFDFMARHTRHFQFGVMYIGGNEIIVAKELVADARAVTSGTRLFDRRILARAVSCQESTSREGRATDVALATGGVTLGTVILERFSQHRRVNICANSFKVGPIAILIDVQIGFVGLNLGSVTKTTRFFWLRARFGNQALVRRGFVRGRAIPVVTKDTTKFTVCGLHELGIATEKNFFPRFQRGDRAGSTLPLRFRRFFNLVDRKFLQRFLIAMAFDTTIAGRNRGG